MSKCCQDCGSKLAKVGDLLECQNRSCDLFRVTLPPEQLPIPDDLVESYRIMNRRIRTSRENHPDWQEE